MEPALCAVVPAECHFELCLFGTFSEENYTGCSCTLGFIHLFNSHQFQVQLCSVSTLNPLGRTVVKASFEIQFVFTVDSDCSHEIKRRLLLGRKATTNLDNVLKSRDITLPTKLWFFPLVTY